MSKMVTIHNTDTGEILRLRERTAAVYLRKPMFKKGPAAKKTAAKKTAAKPAS